MTSETSEALEPATDQGRATRKLVGRGLFLIVSAVSLYLLMPSLLDVFTSWRELFDLRPEWIVAALLFEAACFASIWQLQRIALRTGSWFTVACSQLAGNAFGRIVPGGAAPAAALQYRMLVRAGVPARYVASGLTATTLLSFGLLLALPVLSLPSILGGTPVDRGLAQTAYLGGGVFVLMVAAAVVVYIWDGPLLEIGRIVERIANRTFRRHRHLEGLGAKLLHERDSILIVLGKRWWLALLAATGRWLFDFAALLACLRAVGADPNPSLVLLAFAAASLLGMISITPGGLGLVEAGLTGTLVLAGVAGGAAVVATLAYRLVSFWLPIPAGAAAFWLFRRRYPEHGPTATPSAVPVSPAD
jgi:uncharacterized protein (TIRG00374 family)